MSQSPREATTAAVPATDAAIAAAPTAFTACIFCGKTGATVKINREHTFSDWLNDVLTSAQVGTEINCQRTTRGDDGQAVGSSPCFGTVASGPVTRLPLPPRARPRPGTPPGSPCHRARERPPALTHTPRQPAPRLRTRTGPTTPATPRTVAPAVR
jgi:hypothetical protein